MHQRTKAREIALQSLYQSNFQKNRRRGLSDLAPDSEDNIPNSEIVDYARKLVQGYFNNQKEIDEIIQKTITNWEFDRLALIDKSILCLSCYELLYEKDIPKAVCIDEAIELAKRYSTEKSSGFINGVLDKIASEKKR
jgi:N utilization substance protein B